MTRRRTIIQGAAGLAGGALAGVSLVARAAPPRVLRTSFRIAETGFDPAQISDLYSRTVAAAIFDSPLEFEFLARPYRLRPATLVALPEVSADYRSFTFRVRPGIFFTDDPAFKGARRELVAEDFVYALKRHYDPRWKSTNVYRLEAARLLGLSELRRAAIADKTPFDYAREVEGARTLDRYTYRIRLAESSPRFLLQMADVSWAAVAREVVEFYGDAISEHPVGTGPFRLGEWRRASRIVLERNPGYRHEVYAEDPPAGDKLARAAADALTGRRLPMLDRIEIAIIEENQPRWLAFLNGELDLLDELPAEFADLAIPNNVLAPNLRKRGIHMLRYARSDVSLSYFNMEDPVVGGYTPDKVALRRAISLATDVDKEIRLVRHNQAIPGQSHIAPGVWGYDPAFKSEMSDFDPARAKALLDLYGYVDKNGDGWRDQPDGSPLVLHYATQPDRASRSLVELWQKNMDAIGIRIEFRTAKWPENLKASTAGKLMMWGVGWTAGTPDAEDFMVLAYGPNKGQANKARFDLPAYNAVYQAQRVLPDGPERQALITEAKKLVVAYMPYKIHVHRIYTDLAQPWVIGYHRNTFTGQGRSWRLMDVDPALQAPA
ncbi:MAG TPA: ABC transporter substrate-binding protein [Burkholderiaceae bacterium]|nr:ABC transporter substrate-binding protein [Burkholderiaceae bacterium]